MLVPYVYIIEQMMAIRWKVVPQKIAGFSTIASMKLREATQDFTWSKNARLKNNVCSVEN